MLYRDYEFIRLIEGYLKKIHAREEKLAKKQEIVKNQDAIENVEGNVISIANPQKVVTRKRPKIANHIQNVVMTMQKKGNKKRRQYTCKFCKKPEHNIATCSLKAK
ncbi:39655_t:CDS:1, partial [Gigaspora margarita]